MSSCHVPCVPYPQYVENTTYQGSEVSVYSSSSTEGTKDNNYTLLVYSNTGAPASLTFVGYDRLFGSHYDKYVIVYYMFSSVPPSPDVFDVPDGEIYLHK